MKKELNRRLLSAAEFVRQGARFADIGTDHAYLPIFLLDEGRIEFAVASDINEGPLSTARINAEECGLSDKMEFVLTDGAADLQRFDPTDIAVCGMGGELISNIVNAAPYLKNENIRLILQPMTKAEMLRERLYLSGYEIEAESYSHDGGKLYVCMCVKYTANEIALSEEEIEICPKNTKIVNKDFQIAYLKKKLAVCKKIINGKKAGGEDSEKEERIAGMIDRYINTEEKA